MDWNYIFISLIILFAGAGIGFIAAGIIIFIIELKLKFVWHYWELEGNLLTTLWGSLTINKTTISLFGNFRTRNKPQITYYSIFLIRRSKDV
jgi:hypothetical protein